MSFAPSETPSSWATSCEIPTFAMTNACGARSRTTAYVCRRLGSRSAARWLPTPIPSPWRAAASASVAFTRSAPECPPVIPAIRSGSASSCPSRRVERSTFAASVAGSASWTRWTSSHPGARVVSTSSSAAMRRCSALRRSIAASGPGLFEDAITLECAPFLERETEDLPEDVIVVRADGRAGSFLVTGRRGQPERRRHDVHLADRGMRQRRPHAAVRQLRIAEELGDREHRSDPQPLGAQQADDPVPLARSGPRIDTGVELGARRAPPGGGGGTLDAGGFGEGAPLGVVPHAQRDPPIRARAPVDAMWGGHGVGVAGAAGDPPVRGELEDRRREELQSGLVLREVDRAADPGALPPLERREHRDRAVSDGDVVDVRPVQEHRRRVGLAEELHEARERGELAPVPRMERMRTGLPLIAARQNDELGVLRAKDVRPEPEPSDG